MRRLKYTATLEVMTGLHIGGESGDFEIGGLDNPVVKTRGEPYIPGSSLKGKMRSLLSGNKPNSTVDAYFGSAKQKGKIIFRDAMKISNPDGFKDATEVKFENKITPSGVAVHPRQMERVVPGTKFGVEVIIRLDDGDNEQEAKELIERGFKLLENDALGGSGSRGYGQIKIENNGDPWSYV
jgi:CRISPR-associated protein Csm3